MAQRKQNIFKYKCKTEVLLFTPKSKRKENKTKQLNFRTSTF